MKKAAKINLLLTCIIMILQGCNTHPWGKELDNVVTHYEKEGDRQKIAAAKYLLKNMPGHFATTGDYETCYAELQSVLKSSTLSWKERLDSIEIVEEKWAARIKCIPVEEVLTPEYLIKDIDVAFEQWRNGKWARHLDFGHFCEYLLPFTVSSRQPVFDWINTFSDFANGYIAHLDECYDYQYDPRSAVTVVNTAMKNLVSRQSKQSKSHKVPVFAPELLVQYPNAASCGENADITTLIMRSKGIPVAIDFTPQWPDRINGHEWCTLWSVHGRAEHFTPFLSNPGHASFAHQRISKVFRRTYALNKPFARLMHRHPEVVKTTGTPFFVDVTEEYTAPLNIKVVLDRKVKGGIAYLAVFDNFKWHPVWYGKTFGRHASFKSVGRDIVYIVMSYENGRFVPVSKPFLLDKLGNTNYISASPADKVDIHLQRKAPMHQHVFLVNTLRNGIIEASNDKEKWDTLKMLPPWPLTSGMFSPGSETGYRYWRFAAVGGRTSDMAEIFYYDSGSNEPRRDFELLDASAGYERLYDSDPLTYYSAKGSNYCGCVDFGRPVHIDRIEYILRGDGNAIMPGDTYEVSWWHDGKWELLDRQKATDIWLDVKDVPSGALYYVKDVTSGRENRIFTFDGEQILWH